MQNLSYPTCTSMQGCRRSCKDKTLMGWNGGSTDKTNNAPMPFYGRWWGTVNMVIFAGVKFRENVGKTFHVGIIFTILLLFPS